ncbi:hypothetical protein [Flavobacterium capsici]|uniref:Uncharacterized protein n=1 Tax=Flavobacterium capsici TaxID=3075618 RepID=A0AA96EVI0_9FLAO|nr:MULTISPECIES: hypothetical protein [unclassified Flavobacterium]WNM19254.1 hypothetical protein RN608_00895 [Flavobacterium sp. PMR2A8]WNM20643.1 hypothetical protein RN605_08065 [Flavobacterium sp. PMTSA4]
MITLEKIKDDYAKENNYKSWNEFIEYCCSSNLPHLIAKAEEEISSKLPLSNKKVDIINGLVQRELDFAQAKFPKFASAHEGYAVLLEEIQEMDEEMDIIRVINDVFWKKVKTNSDPSDTLHQMKLNVLNLIKEAIQVAAMIKRFENDVLNMQHKKLICNELAKDEEK